MALIGSRLLICLALLSLPSLACASKTYVVKKKDSLSSVARKYHVSLADLKSVNNLSGTRVEKGTRLVIPSRSGKKTEVASERKLSHKVAKGETLTGIARKTGVKLSDLRKLNHLKGNKVKPGMVLALGSAPVVPAERIVPQQPALAPTLSVNKELLTEQEVFDTLAELTDIDIDRPVDLAKNIEESSSAYNIKKSAYSFLGARYRFGGTSRNALDCSSFVQQVFRDQKVSLPRTAREQFHVGKVVARGDLQKGDLVFFQTYAAFPSHVGIYLGNRKMIHASSRDRKVVISSMDTPYYLARYLGAKRIAPKVKDTVNFDELLAGVEEELETDAQENDTLGLNLKD